MHIVGVGFGGVRAFFGGRLSYYPHPYVFHYLSQPVTAR